MVDFKINGCLVEDVVKVNFLSKEGCFVFYTVAGKKVKVLVEDIAE